MQCRVDGGGEGGGMRTVECLRGRLLAERVASKAAKEEADQLAKRLDELEKKLAGEIEVRNTAERRLRRAVKKLQSLKILDVELSDSSAGSLSSSGCSAARPAPAEERNDDPVSLSTARSTPRGEAEGCGRGGDGDSARGSCSAGSCGQASSSSMDGSWCSVRSEQSQSGPSKEENRVDAASVDTNHCRSVEGAGDYDPEREEPVASNGSAKSEQEEELYRDAEDDRLALVPVDPRYDGEVPDDSRTGDSGAGTPAARRRRAGADANADSEEEEEEKNKLAIVPVDVPQPPPPPQQQQQHDVQSVLLALRQVKERLRYTIERRSPELAAHHHQELCGH